jgi:hypothetical protein
MTQIAPYFSLGLALWVPGVPAVLTWDAATGELQRFEGPEGFGDLPPGSVLPSARPAARLADLGAGAIKGGSVLASEVAPVTIGGA